MKKVLLIIAILTFSLSVQAQKMTASFLEGQWTSNGVGTEITIKVTNKKKLSITVVSSYSGENVKVVSYLMHKNNLYMETLFEPNNFGAITKYFIIDKDTMVADVVSGYPGQVIYKRVLNNKTN